MESAIIGRPYALLFIIGILGLLFGLIFLSIIVYKMKAKKLGVKITWGQVIGQRIRTTLTYDILEAAALANEQNISVNIKDLETHKLAGGNPYKVIAGLIDNKEYGLTLNEALALDLAGLEITKEEITRLFRK